LIVAASAGIAHASASTVTIVMALREFRHNFTVKRLL
jgi:hypothetical protein